MTTSPWRVAGYLLEQPLGRGAQARVWRGRVRRTGDAVAIKLVPVHGREQRDAARAEAAALTGLDHPHLVHLHEAVPCGPGLALVLDLAAGGSLAELLAARGRLSAGEVVTTIAPIGAALAYAHNAGVVHGDVSAANIVFTDIGLPLLADLGVSRLAGDEGGAGDAGPLRCTPAYVDPAVAAGGVPAPASDVFMLAGVALHALTGAPPWPAPTAAQAYAAAARGEVGDLAGRLRGAEVPAGVADVVAAGLQPDPARRPTAAEFALDLRHATEPVAVELGAGRARPPAGDPGRDERGPEALLTYGHRVPPPAPARARARRGRPGALGSRWRLAGSAGLLAALVAGLLWWGHGPGQPDHPADAPRPAPAGAPAATGGHATREPAPVAPVGAAGPSRAVGVRTPQPAPPPAALDAVAARRVLAGLDAVRARAYVRRDPTLLDRVYASARLRRQDTAQLRAIVPAGCGLAGVHNRYRDVTVVARDADRVTLRARVVLHASRLLCSGRAAGRARAGRPERLRIVLLRVDGRYLIAALGR
jgi:hypothetical protein